MYFRSTIVRGSVLVLGLVASLSVAAGCGRYSISNLRSVKAFKDGTEAYKKSDFVEAAKHFEESISYSGDQGIVYFYLANCYDQQFKPSHKGEPANDEFMKKAVENYQKAIDVLSKPTTGTEDPKLVEAYEKFRRYSYEYMIAAYGPDKLDDFDKAEPIAKKLIELTPNEPVNYQALGKLYEDRGMYDQAEEMFKKAVQAKPSDPSVFTALAGYYNRQGDFDKTMEALRQRTALEPNNPEAYHYMATFYQDKVAKEYRLTKPEQRQYVLQGIEAEDKALALNPNYSEAMVYKNIFLRQQANTEKDPGAQKRLIDEADRLRAKAIELQKKANQAAGDAAAAGAKKEK